MGTKRKPEVRSADANLESFEPSDVAMEGGGSRPEGDEELEKVREILFGAQLREEEEKLRELEGRVSAELERLRRETAERFEALARETKTEFQTIVDKLRVEQNERVRNHEELGKKLKETGEAMAALEKTATESGADLETRMAAANERLVQQIQEQHAQAMSALENVAETLKNDKVGRTELVQLFAEVAARLEGERPKSQG